MVVARAREHNLKDVSVKIPHGKLTVVTGPSGSGKSTLAFDVVFAEGQRRFLETLTPYARQFLPTMPRPDVDRVTGVPPSIALEQRTARAGGKSTVATVTEVAHYLRLLYAKLGVAHCPTHDTSIVRTSPAAILDKIRALRAKVTLLAPAIQARKGTYLDLFAAAAREGIEASYADGKLVSNDDPPRLVRSHEHTIDLLISSEIEARALSDADFARALRWGNGAVKLRVGGKETLHSTLSACPKCGFSVPELESSLVLVRHQAGALRDLRRQRGDRKRVETRSEEESRNRARCRALPRLSRRSPLAHPARGARGGRALPRAVGPLDRRRERTGAKVQVRKRTNAGRETDPGRARTSARLPARRGARLLVARSRRAHAFWRRDAALAAGGAARRRTHRALYVLDEPTIGLHPRDTGRLLGNLRNLVNLGSTVLVVEHDTETIRAADHLIDLGRAVVHAAAGGGRGHARASAGRRGIADCRALAAAPALREPRAIDRAAEQLILTGATQNNLKDVDLSIRSARSP